MIHKHEVLYEQALEFLNLYYSETNKSHNELEDRLTQVRAEIIHTGTYIHTYEELLHGARVAWRNSNRCIGRLFWETLRVNDYRHLKDAEAIAHALFEHIKQATNHGHIVPMLTALSATGQGRDVRIWNHQLIRYAGYETARGEVWGDPASITFTKVCESLGWQGTGGAYDILPLVIQVGESTPKYFPIPDELILEIPLIHPTEERFNQLALKWYAVPIISDMNLVIGGVSYPAAPFNGWYMGTEIGARNLADEDRYNVLPKVAECFDLDTSREATLWRDEALVELNKAVLYSYKQAGVSMVDHHTAAKQFALFEEKEKKADRKVTGQWSWLIPPMSPATTHIFRKGYYPNDMVMPNYLHQDKPYV